MVLSKEEKRYKKKGIMRKEGRKENLASGKLEKKGVKIKQNGIL